MASTRRQPAHTTEPPGTPSDDSEPDEAEELRQAALEAQLAGRAQYTPAQPGLPKGFSLTNAIKELMHALPDEQQARDALLATADNIQGWEQ